MPQTPPEARLERVLRIRRMQADGTAQRLREQHRVSQTTLAKAIGVTPETLNRWEQGHMRPREPLALAWLDVLERLEKETPLAKTGS